MEHLAITVLGAQQHELVNDLIQHIAKNQCNIRESRITLLGNQLAAMMLVAGNWSAIAKLESTLLAMQKKSTALIHVKRAEIPIYPDTLLPYIVQVIALDNPGLIFNICNFFITQEININDLQSNPFTSTYAGAQMTTINLNVSIPADINLADLRERFMFLCDELNVDGILEPEKH